MRTFIHRLMAIAAARVAVQVCPYTNSQSYPTQGKWVYFNASVLVTPGATSCVLTGWATMVVTNGTSWETPRYQRSRSPELTSPGLPATTPAAFLDTPTTANGMYPAVGITLRWDSGDSRQQCYAGPYLYVGF
ncbi:hypothetical protein ACQPZJ_46180 [Actinoplanes sp. CA-054009]